MKLNLEKLRITLKTMGEYLFPVEKVTSYFKSIKSKKDLQKFIQQRSAHVTQTTLYGYLKTRIGVKFTAMVEDDVFSKSINIAKWNIYHLAIFIDFEKTSSSTIAVNFTPCLLYTSPSPRDLSTSRMPSSA